MEEPRTTGCVEPKERSMADWENKPYPIFFIFACVAAAIVLMVWTFSATNGPASLDASKKPAETIGSTSNRSNTTNQSAFPAPTLPGNEGASDGASSSGGDQIR